MRNVVPVNIQSTREAAPRNVQVMRDVVKLPLHPVLATARFRVKLGDGCFKEIRLICDSGAQANLLSEFTLKELGLVRQPVKANIVGIDESSVHTKGQVVLDLWHRTADRQVATTKFVLLEYFHLDHPQQSFSHMMFPSIEESSLADSNYNTQGRIDGILGIEVLSRQLLNGLRRNPLGLMAQATGFGWIIFGGVTAGETIDTLHAVNIVTAGELHTQIRRLWEIDEAPEKPVMSSEDQKCEELYQQTVVRNDGRYAVSMLLKPDAELGESRTMARRRLYCLENRFKRNPALRELYINFMDEYEKLGHMRKAEPLKEGAMHYYIPHHAVERKFRVVFDASAKTSNGKSLNELQYVGPRLQKDLLDIVMNFRTGQYAVSADVCKMFRQIQMRQEYWDLQRILWRKNQQEPIEEYWLTVVTYGMVSSPYNAVKTLQQCAIDNASKFPRAAEVTQSDFYMDDLLTSVETPMDAVAIKRELRDLLSEGGFELAKWRSNCDAIADECEAKNVQEQDSTSVLGIMWNYKEDEFQFKVQGREQPAVITKRIMTSEAARVYDPQGYVTPITIRAKLFIQELWRTGSDWDAPLSEEMQNEWRNFYQEIQAIAQIKIPRWLRTSSTTAIQVHLYSDASSKAYGAAAYVRVHTDGRWSARLLYSKSRVAPLKIVTIPRLELCAVELACSMLRKIKEIPMLKDAQIFIWTDSEIVLHWLRKSVYDLKLFVANRVSRILHHVTMGQTHHVRSEENPADLLSRGVKAESLVGNTLWWNGPRTLTDDVENWPHWNMPAVASEVSKQIDAEVKEKTIKFPHVFLTVVMKDKQGNKKEISLLEEKSSYREVCRITSCVLRFCNQLYKKWCERKGREEKKLPLLEIYSTKAWQSQITHEVLTEGKSYQYVRPTIAECENSLYYWVIASQKESFPDEYKKIAKGETLSQGNQLWTLTPQMDRFGVMRICGRLANTNLAAHVKHPIILHRRSTLAKRVATESHRIMCHGGVQMCTQYLRNKYWVLGVRLLMRHVVYYCKTCALYRQAVSKQFMADLPAIRLQPAPAFESTGVDYAGPIKLKVSRNVTTKGYIAVFVCMVYKTVHLELVSDMTSEAFIAALTRFVNIRAGRVKHMYSDNGKTFIGADRELREAAEVWKEHEVMKYLEECSIQWHYIVPHAPHQGGLWEAAVKSAKGHLKRMSGAQLFTFEEMATLLAKISACLNSRPLTPMSNDPSDLHTLTPGHFITGQNIVTPYEGYIGDQPTNRLSAWQKIQKLQEEFWIRWSQEYITEQQSRNKWAGVYRSLRLGDLVFIKDEVTPPCQWLLARVVKVFEGPDGKVRSCEVMVDHETKYVRPVTKLCLLPIDEPEELEIDEQERDVVNNEKCSNGKQEEPNET